jgi:hypothetical protein
MAQSSVTRTCLLPVGRVLTCCLLIALAGCWGGSDDGLSRERSLDDEDRVARLISGMSDAVGTAEGFQALFAEGAAPPESERSRYKLYMFSATSAAVSGDSATATVRVENAADDKLVGEVEWTAVRVGEGWKVKEAPLP